MVPFKDMVCVHGAGGVGLDVGGLEAFSNLNEIIHENIYKLPRGFEVV